jgi:hypothetical protein
MANLNELNFGKEALDIDLDDLPEQMVPGDYTLRQPGWHLYKLPNDFDFSLEADEDGKEYLKASFQGAYSLVYADNPTQRHSDNFDTKVRYVEIDGEQKKIASLAYLLAEGFGETGKLKTHQDVGNALIKHTGETFKGRLEWSATCRSNKAAVGANGEDLGRTGCGTRYRERKVTPKKVGGFSAEALPKNSQGEFSERFQCSCGAVVRAFGNIRGFGQV